LKAKDNVKSWLNVSRLQSTFNSYSKNLSSALACDYSAAENVLVLEEDAASVPDDNCLLFFPDAKGIVELAATRLMRESTASRVRDILTVGQHTTVTIQRSSSRLCQIFPEGSCQILLHNKKALSVRIQELSL
jgi:hypothetical protein